MIHFISTLMTSVCLTASFLGILYLHRRTGKINTPYGLYGVAIFTFTLWHFFCPGYTNSGSDLHEILTGLFVLVSIGFNAYCAERSQFEVGMNRRKIQLPTYNANCDRRHRKTFPVIKTDK